jgi:prepilin-type N-terminal cleavage/methylation domain-containing protein
MEQGNDVKVHASRNGVRGATLVELMVVVIIVGILAAVAIPVFTDYLRESRLSEAVTNIQGILEAEQGYFITNGRYTAALGWCPGNLPQKRWTTQLWPDPSSYATECNVPPGSAAGWSELGWEPDSPLYFRYRVFSHNTGLPNCVPPNTLCPSENCCAICGNPAAVPPVPDTGCVEIGLGLAPQNSGLGLDSDRAGINWQQEGFAAGRIAPWCVVEAEADMDLNNASVFIRGNSYNHRTYRSPNPENDSVTTW